VCELLACVEYGVREVGIPLRDHPVVFQEDGLGVFEEVCVNPLPDFEGDA